MALIMIASAVYFLKESPTTAMCLTTLLGIFLSTYYYRKWARRQKWSEAGRDVVVLHEFLHNKPNPNIGPFVVKLKTYLRMAEIKYVTDSDQPMGPKGKCPWITFNGKEFSDSQLIIEYLSHHFKKDFSSHLTEEQKSIARSMQIMAEEHLYWGIVSWRYVEDKDFRVLELTDALSPFFRYLKPLLRYWLSGHLKSQGIGRHSVSERRDIMVKDIESLATYLGEKPYFMGPQPTELDCCLYGQLSQLVWNAPGSPYEQLIKEKHQNLEKFCVRMRDQFDRP